MEGYAALPAASLVFRAANVETTQGEDAKHLKKTSARLLTDDLWNGFRVFTISQS